MSRGRYARNSTERANFTAGWWKRAEGVLFEVKLLPAVTYTKPAASLGALVELCDLE
jgi:hypothetical protein